jgi:ATP-dependent DNA helicase RecQ
MGIDKSNVRYVIHYNMPQSMENYYQEAGRAGRDGEPAQCILLFGSQDVMINRFLLDTKEYTDISPDAVELLRARDIKRLQLMEGYCQTWGCLRNYILEYFGEKRKEPCNSCGNCHKEFMELDMTAEAKQVINCVWEARGRYGINIIIGTLRGANRARLKELGTVHYKSYGALKACSVQQIRLVIRQLIMEGYINQTADKFSVIQLGDIEPLKKPEAHVIVRVPKDRLPAPEEEKKSRGGMVSLTKEGYELFEQLRQLRLAFAREEGLPPYIIFSDKTLIEMSARLPCSREAMLNISGIGEVKFEKYGKSFMETVTAFMSGHPDVITGAVPEAAASEGTGGKAFDWTEYNRNHNKPDGAGSSWTDKEDKQLDDEYHAGMEIAEIAKLHSRTSGAIRARLKKHGLIE